MSSSPLTKRLFAATELVLLGATVVAAAWLHRGQEWHPAALVVLLIVLAVLSEWFSVELNAGTLSASTVAIVLAMGLLGPAPAAACGIAAVLISSTPRRLPFDQWLNNLATFAAMPFGGGLVLHAVVEHFHLLDPGETNSLVLGLVLLGVFAGALVLNFVLIGLRTLVEDGRSLRRQLPEFLPLLPGELAAGALASILAIAYRSAGLPALVAAIAVLLIFQHLTVALLRSEERAEQLQARSRQLVGLQLGVLRTLVRALEMRDESSARHAAAVSAYATALGAELGCAEDELDVIRAAGLLHEIGKFTWPDRVLHAESVSQEDQPIIESHPQVGSILVGALDGYGPVADAILYHHERMDGRGYPAGLIGEEIPLTSRILAVCSTYDAMSRRQGYRSGMSPEEAITELQLATRSGQLDPVLVESFIALLRR
ncbi:MAG: HD-GYP domain-containing protein, partial [Solirubrobacteraceae bacterium]